MPSDCPQILTVYVMLYYTIHKGIESGEWNKPYKKLVDFPWEPCWMKALVRENYEYIPNMLVTALQMRYRLYFLGPNLRNGLVLWSTSTMYISWFTIFFSLLKLMYLKRFWTGIVLGIVIVLIFESFFFALLASVSLGNKNGCKCQHYDYA